jgi:hypothetical protein
VQPALAQSLRRLGPHRKFGGGRAEMKLITVLAALVVALAAVTVALF